MGKAMEDMREEFRQKGIKQGATQGRMERALYDLRSLMETLGLSLEQVMAALKIPEADRPKYLGLLGQG